MKNRITLFAILLIAVTTSNPLFAQIQLGLDIDGAAAGDRSGRQVSLSSDGSRVAIGARQNDGNGTDAGHVRVFDWNGNDWTQVGQDINGEAAGDESGWTVSLSSDGNRLAIGARYNDGNGTNAGHVRVYDLIGMTWEQVGEDIDGEAADDISGHELSLSSDGSRVAIGAINNDGNGFEAGHVRIYELSGTVWTQVGTDIDGDASGDRFSRVSLSSDGNRVAIGAPFNDGNGIDAGHVRVYDYDAIGMNWTQVGDDINGAAGDNSGFALSLSSDGNRVAVGARFNGDNGDYSGQVRVFDWNGANWAQVGEDMDGEAAGNQFGYSISLSSDGNRVAAGTHVAAASNGAGHVRVFEWDSLSWTQACANIDGEDAGDFFGISISLSPDGNRLAIGGARNGGNGFEAGHVRVFEDCKVVSTIEPNETAIIEVYPNPTSGKIELLGVEYGTIKIIDNFGRLIWKAQQSATEIDISNLPSGVYFIQIILDDQFVTKKIIKE